MRVELRGGIRRRVNVRERTPPRPRPSLSLPLTHLVFEGAILWKELGGQVVLVNGRVVGGKLVAAHA